MIIPATLNIGNTTITVDVSVNILSPAWSHIPFNITNHLNLSTENIDVSSPHKGIQNVYLIRMDETTYKIGYGNVQQRLKALQTGNPNKLRVIACCPGGQCLEDLLQRKYSHKSIRGEWFKLDDTDVENIKIFMFYLSILI